MRRIIAITQVSLDGVMQSPGGPQEDPTDGFGLGGWAMHFQDDVEGQALEGLLSGEFELLLGRRTYEIFAAYWPYQTDNPIGKAFDKATKHVATRTLERLDWAGSKALAGDAVEEVRRLKASEGPDLHVWGSGQLLQALMAAGLIDEHQMWTFPVVLGKGRRLFERGLPAQRLSLVDTKAGKTGVMIHTFRPAGPLPQEPAIPDAPTDAELARRGKAAGEGAGMELQGIARLRIHPGKLEEFKRLSGICADRVRAKDKGTLQYELYFNDDETECLVLERYRDSPSLLDHFRNMGEAGSDIFRTCTGAGEVCGAASPALVETLKGSPVQVYKPFLRDKWIRMG